MSIAEIKERLHLYIDVADDKKIEALYILLEEEIERTQEAIRNTASKT